MSEDLEALGRWAVRSFAVNRGEEERKPLLVVVGGDFDALATSSDIRVSYDDVEQLAWLMGYVGFPCDAIYVVATWEGISVERDIDHVAVGPAELDATTRLAVISWAHCIPTGESLLLTMSRHLADDGTSAWVGLSDPAAAELDTFAPLRAVAHDFDRFPIEPEGRQKAMQLLLGDNEHLHESIFYEPGSLLEAARTQRDNQTGVD